jgi:DNA-binding PadR family transcriptional regulator
MSLQYAILGLLSYKSMSGYDIKLIIDKSINYFWSAHLSQIYRELSLLENKELISSIIEKQNDRPDKKIYSIEESGKIVFNEWLKSTPNSLSAPVRDEFSARVFFGSHLQHNELINLFEKFIEEKRMKAKALSAIESYISKMADEFNTQEDKLYWGLTLKRGIMMNEVLIKWGEECIELLTVK